MPVAYYSCTCCVFADGPGKLIVNYCRSPNRFRVKAKKILVVPVPSELGTVSSKRNWFPKWLKPKG